MNANFSTGIGSVADLVKDAIDKWGPEDPALKAAQQLSLAQMDQAGHFKEIDAQLALSAAQTDINKVEATSTSILVSGWRPAIGWVGAVSLFSYYVPYCLIATGVWAYQCVHLGAIVPRPDLGIADLIALIGTLLGFGTLRSIDKGNGVASK